MTCLVVTILIVASVLITTDISCGLSTQAAGDGRAGAARHRRRRRPQGHDGALPRQEEGAACCADGRLGEARGNHSHTDPDDVHLLALHAFQ